MSNFIDDLVAATRRHGVTCVVLNGNGDSSALAADFRKVPDQRVHEDDDDEDKVVPPFMQPANGGQADAGETDKLRAQVQKLTAELQQAQRAPAANGGATAPVPAGDHGSVDGLSVETLGFEDDALTKKLMRTGYETIGKLREAFMGGALAAEGAKMKKDWLIEVGMKLAGAGPSSGAPAPAPSGGAAPAAGDLPAGHSDRPWLERLAVAREKQRILSELRGKLAEKQAEAQKLAKSKKPIPEELDDAVVELEDEISITETQQTVLRWTMNLDTDKTITLDEALGRANLGPWMANPQPRIAPQA